VQVLTSFASLLSFATAHLEIAESNWIHQTRSHRNSNLFSSDVNDIIIVLLVSQSCDPSVVRAKQCKSRLTYYFAMFILEDPIQKCSVLMDNRFKT